MIGKELIVSAPILILKLDWELDDHKVKPSAVHSTWRCEILSGKCEYRSSEST